MCRLEYLCACMRMYVCRCLRMLRRGYQIPTELELQLVVSHPTWVLGAELGSSERAARAHSG